METKYYVLGLAFSEDRETVLLIEKNRPDWQKGKYNGIGGKVEPGEVIEEAMSREFKEETGVDISPDRWDYLGNMIFEEDELGGEAIVFCFRIFTDDIHKAQTKEDEKIQSFSVMLAGQLPSSNGNLKYLMQLALHERVKNIQITY